MAEALRNVREKKMGWQLASKIFNVPATTLRRRFKNNCNSTKGDFGGKRPVFSREMEDQFAQHIKDMEANNNKQYHQYSHNLTHSLTRTILWGLSSIASS